MTNWIRLGQWILANIYVPPYGCKCLFISNRENQVCFVFLETKGMVASLKIVYLFKVLTKEAVISFILCHRNIKLEV